jgi:ribokinase
MNSKKITVVGSYLVALVMDSERIPLKGETLMANNFRTTHGGKGSNQAVQAARLGARVDFVGRIGNDSFGKAFLDLLDREKINRAFVFVSEDLPTGAGFIISAADGHNLITIDVAAIRDFNKNDINRILSSISEDNIVLAQLEIPLESALYALEHAKKTGALTILNPAPASFFKDGSLSFVDILTPNETEARICTGLAPDSKISDEEIALRLLKTGAKHIIVTLGEKGCLWAHRGKVEPVSPFHISEVVDSTGAGDAFNAGLAVALAEGRQMREAIQFANAAGALSVTKADTIPSYHYRHEVDDFIHRFPLLNSSTA